MRQKVFPFQMSRETLERLERLCVRDSKCGDRINDTSLIEILNTRKDWAWLK